MPFVDRTGETYGRWTVLERAGSNDNGDALYLCRCECGTERVVRGSNLVNGSSSSCGCGISQAGGIERRTMVPVAVPRDKTHPLYESWKSIRRACNNPSARGYRWYGAKGVTVDPRWDSFDRFVDDVGERPHGARLSRTHPDAPFSPETVVWRDAQSLANYRRSRAA